MTHNLTPPPVAFPQSSSPGPSQRKGVAGNQLVRPPESEIRPAETYAAFMTGASKVPRKPAAVLSAHGGRITLRLPLPNPKASQNARPGFEAKRAGIIREMRNEACRVALAARLQGELYRQIRRARAEVRFIVPDRIRRDPMNLMAACKAYIDGFVQAGLLYDDDHFVAVPIEPFTVNKEDPHCEITLYELDKSEDRT